MQEWIQHHHALVWWLAATSVFTLLAGVVAGPWWIIRIPADYFVDRTRPKRAQPLRISRLVWSGVRNLVGVAFILMGILMLVLPGQGLLSLLVGVMLTDLPVKYRIARWIIGRPAIRNSINWLRGKAGKGALVLS
jgi:hypothetical protein